VAVNPGLPENTERSTIIIMIDPLKDIDWNLVWKSQMKRNRDSSPGRDCARIWESRERACAAS
jgi:hypothetical protein